MFVTGHHRSASTNIHKTVSSLEGVTTGDQVDAIFPSLLLKYAVSGCTSMIQQVFYGKLINKDEIKEHKFGAGEELEEHVFMMHHMNAPGVPT